MRRNGGRNLKEKRGEFGEIKRERERQENRTKHGVYLTMYYVRVIVLYVASLLAVLLSPRGLPVTPP